MEAENASKKKTPWHLWLIAALASVWYFSGTYTIVMAQLGRLADISAEQAAYYAAQPVWLVLLTDVSLIAASIASISLFFRHRSALWFFSVSLSTIIVTNCYEIMSGTSRTLVDSGSMVLTLIIVVIAALLVLYSWRMSRRGLLK